MNFSLTIFLVPHHANGAASVNYKHLRLRSGWRCQHVSIADVPFQWWSAGLSATIRWNRLGRCHRYSGYGGAPWKPNISVHRFGITQLIGFTTHCTCSFVFVDSDKDLASYSFAVKTSLWKHKLLPCEWFDEKQRTDFENWPTGHKYRFSGSGGTFHFRTAQITHQSGFNARVFIFLSK